MTESGSLFPVPPRFLTQAQFVEIYGGVYEHTPSIALNCHRQGLDATHDSVDGLSRALVRSADAMTDGQWRDLINAHPDLAGRAAVAGELTEHSTSEQACAGIEQCSAAEFARFQQFNQQYKDTFGFTFVMAVKGSNRHAILESFSERLNNDAETEFRRAIAEIHKIARLRLQAIAANRMASHPFGQWINLAQPRLGTTVEFATDDFFADRRRLIEPADPEFFPDRFDDHGKWMDGWESRRKRTPGHDFCVVKLGVPGVIKGIEIDTSHFTGNYPPEASLEACTSADTVPGDHAGWQEILPTVPLRGDSRHFHAVQHDEQFTHVRLHIYPDGGVARLRVFGEIQPDWSTVAPDQVIDLLALENGGKALLCNDEHFGTMHNLNAPGRGVNMADGWETARRRVPGNDWVILALGHPGTIESVLVDTAHFKGNYPDRVAIRAALLDETQPANLAADSLAWNELLAPTRLQADREHRFVSELNEVGPVSHVRLDIFPDGGISRVRLFGRLHRRRGAT